MATQRVQSGIVKPLAEHTGDAGRDGKGRFANGNGIGHRFRAGESGNPAGRPANGGASIRERVNDLLAQPDLTLAMLRKLADDSAPERATFAKLHHNAPSRHFVIVIGSCAKPPPRLPR